MGMNIFSYAIMLLGFSIILLEVIIWKKQKITLIHGNHKTNIKKEDVKEYTKSIGKAHIIMGIATLSIIILRLTNNDIYDYIGLIICLIGFVTSIVKIIKAQKKYRIGIWE